jgi:protoporphyrinogen oxidase
MRSLNVLVIGAGLSGLACARTLAARGVSVRVLERADRVGGRAETRTVEGYRVEPCVRFLVDGYPSTLPGVQCLPAPSRPFSPDALVRWGARFERVPAPLPRPWNVTRWFGSPIGTWRDKLKAVSCARAKRASEPGPDGSPRPTLWSALREEYGFSASFTSRFLRPLLGGLLLDPNLDRGHEVFAPIYASLAAGRLALPSMGASAIAVAMAAALPEGTLQLEMEVTRVDGGFVRTRSGDVLRADAVVVATDAASAAHLLDTPPPTEERSVTTLHFAAPEIPFDPSMLLLNGESRGPVNHVVVPSTLAPGAAPPGSHLLSATVLGSPRMDDAALLVQVRAQLEEWFGAPARSWRCLATLRQSRAFDPTVADRFGTGGPVIVCPEQVDCASVSASLASGHAGALAALAA